MGPCYRVQLAGLPERSSLESSALPFPLTHFHLAQHLLTRLQTPLSTSRHLPASLHLATMKTYNKIAFALLVRVPLR